MMKTNALFLALATLAFGLAPVLGPAFSGYDPAQFPVLIDRPAIQPAGYAFSIWGVIYLWLFLHAGFGLVKRAETPAWDRVRWPLTVAVAVGAPWQAIALESALWGTVTIWIMAAGAILAFLRADPLTDRWMLSGPTAIFAGWLSAAAAVSTGVLVAGYGWLGDTAAAGAMLALVLAIAVSVQMRRPAMPVYGLTVIWALVGVIVANRADNLTVAGLAGAGIGVMAITLWASRRG